MRTQDIEVTHSLITPVDTDSDVKTVLIRLIVESAAPVVAAGVDDVDFRDTTAMPPVGTGSTVIRMALPEDIMPPPTTAFNDVDGENLAYTVFTNNDKVATVGFTEAANANPVAGR